MRQNIDIIPIVQTLEGTKFKCYTVGLFYIKAKKKSQPAV
jgi:hypothetical protein